MRGVQIYEAEDKIEKINILDEEFEVPAGIIPLMEVVESAYEYQPKDKRTILYKNWITKYNELVKICNKRVGFKMFIFL